MEKKNLIILLIQVKFYIRNKKIVSPFMAPIAMLRKLSIISIFNFLKKFKQNLCKKIKRENHLIKCYSK